MPRRRSLNFAQGTVIGRGDSLRRSRAHVRARSRAKPAAAVPATCRHRRGRAAPWRIG